MNGVLRRRKLLESWEGACGRVGVGMGDDRSGLVWLAFTRGG
jgi:hypothetical protein